VFNARRCKHNLTFRALKERADQFSKRMSKDNRQNKWSKDSLKQQLQAARDAFEASHLGNYRRCYPHPDIGTQAKYDKLLAHSLSLWNQ
jgi:hypothetical protein